MEDQPILEYTEWEFSDHPELLKGSVTNFSDGVLRKDARPHKWAQYPIELKEGCGLSVRLFAATRQTQDDLVEYRWTHDDKALGVVVSKNAMRIDFDLGRLSEYGAPRGAACVAAVTSWVENVLKLEGKYPAVNKPMPYEVNLPWPAELQEGAWFSSAPDQSLLTLRGIPFLFDRVDAFVENGVLSILVYKKIGQLMGYQDGSEWFDDEFRALVHQKAREQGITAPATQGK